jgi:hypothetical protein
MSEIKLCKDCKHSDMMTVGQLGCLHPDVIRIDPVQGHKFALPCFRARYDSGFCKPEGIMHEKRETILEIIKRVFSKDYDQNIL